MTTPRRSPGPLSLRAVHDDDALLDEIGRREGHRQLAAEPVAKLLQALVADVDHGLPTGVDRLATQALAAALVPTEHRPGRGRAGLTASVLPVRSAQPQPGRMVRVRRGTAALVAAAFVLGSAGIAAAVTGTVPDALFVNRVARLLTGAPAPVPTTTNAQPAQGATRSELARRLREQAGRPAGPDAAELARLLRLAATLPDHGGPRVQALVRQLRAKQALGTAASRAKASPAAKKTSPAPPAVTQPNAATPKQPAPTPSATRRTRAPSNAATTGSTAPATKASRASTRLRGDTGSADAKATTARR